MRTHCRNLSNFPSFYNKIQTISEIKDYALRIGIDPKKESHLLPIAKDGLMRALPRDWQVWYETNLTSSHNT